jgi:predicted AAA+ superfamily ATPase
MVAHYHGQVWNAAEFARSMGSAEATARRYLDILEGAYMVRVLPPWFENLRKRQVKAPKIYIRDSGLLHSLLGVSSISELQGHPKIGASWEGFAMEQIISALRTRDTYFWATHAGAELDLMVPIGGKRHGFEFKYTDAPTTRRSMHIAIRDLGLEHLWVVYPGDVKYALTEKITAIPLADACQIKKTLIPNR